MKRDLLSWLIFIALSFIWGSSFILMKIGLETLSAYQVAAIRIASAGLVLSPVAFRSLKKIPREKLLLVFLTGTIGNLIPAFLFCIAEEVIDSSLSGTINSLTPVFTIIVGAMFFKSIATKNQIAGVIIAFTGTSLLFLGKGSLHSSKDVLFAFLIVIATILYGLNVNIVHKHLKEIPSLQIVSVAMVSNGIIALIVLYATGYFNLVLSDENILHSTAAATVLGTIGTALATIIFYILLKRAGSVFASLVTYGMPFVAIFWGFVRGENIGTGQIACLIIILIGVYWTSRRNFK